MRRRYIRTYGMFYWSHTVADEVVVTMGAFSAEDPASSFGLAL